MPNETILEVGGEGGALKIDGQNVADGKWQFCVKLNETAINECLSEEDRGKPEDYLKQSKYVYSLQNALTLIDQGPWFRLYPPKIHPEFFEKIIAEVRKRSGEKEETRWRERSVAVTREVRIGQVGAKLVFWSPACGVCTRVETGLVRSRDVACQPYGLTEVRCLS